MGFFLQAKALPGSAGAKNDDDFNRRYPAGVVVAPNPSPPFYGPVSPGENPDLMIWRQEHFGTSLPCAIALESGNSSLFWICFVLMVLSILR